MLVINPTYYGVCTNLKEIVDLVHSYNMPVLVDEAHGVLIHFHDKLPMSAMEAGADMAATSVHKLGGSMTQSSVLNVKGNRVNPKRIQTIISMLTTTSTSYILLGFIRYVSPTFGSEWHATWQNAQLSLLTMHRKQINEIPESLLLWGRNSRR